MQEGEYHYAKLRFIHKSWWSNPSNPTKIFYLPLGGFVFYRIFKETLSEPPQFLTN